MNTFTTREDWLAQAIAELRSVFSALNHPLPDNIRVACGFPSSNARSAKNRAVGEHWSAKASADQTHEILISPVIDDPVGCLAFWCMSLPMPALTAMVIRAASLRWSRLLALRVSQRHNRGREVQGRVPAPA
jgi:hypothetical protein